ncbi:MAG: hypothetical protein ACR2OC_04455 [Solirubrobacterales bacterium]
MAGVRWRSAAAAVVAALAIAGCGGDDDDATTASSTTVTTTTGATGASGATGADGAGESSSDVKGALAPLTESLESNGYTVSELPLELYEGQPSVENGAEAAVTALKGDSNTSIYAFPSPEDASAWAVDIRDTSTGSKVEVVGTFGFNGAKDDANVDLETVIEDSGAS